MKVKVPSPVIKGYRPSVASFVQDDEKLIVTPRYEKFLLKNPDVLVDRKTLRKVMAEVTKPPRDRTRSFSASSAGYCLRRQELAFIGVRKNPNLDPRGIRIFNNGTFVHLRWQIGLLSAEIIDDIEYTVTMPKLRARANLDGIGTVAGGRYDGADFLWEHKGRMSYSFTSQARAGIPDVKTQKQVAMQQLVSGLEIGVVTNENKDTQEIYEFVIERTAEKIREAKKELVELNKAIDTQTLHPMLKECVKQNKTGEFYKCPFGTPGGACINSGSWPR